VIDWGSMADDQDCSLSLACTQTWYGTDGAPIESDIRFNTKYPWAAGARAGRYDIQSAAVHEFGHVFQLDHVTSSANKGYTLVMWPYIGPDNVSAHKLGRGDAIADNRNY
jgi:hypothetical protein